MPPHPLDFDDTTVTKHCSEREVAITLELSRIQSLRPYMIPILSTTRDTITMPRLYPRVLPPDQQVTDVDWLAMWTCLHELHKAGYMHGSPHMGNFLLVDQRCVMIDFEETRHLDDVPGRANVQFDWFLFSEYFGASALCQSFAALGVDWKAEDNRRTNAEIIALEEKLINPAPLWNWLFSS